MEDLLEKPHFIYRQSHLGSLAERVYNARSERTQPECLACGKLHLSTISATKTLGLSVDKSLRSSNLTRPSLQHIGSRYGMADQWGLHDLVQCWIVALRAT